MVREFKDNDIERVMQLWLDSNIEAHDFIDKKYWENNFEMVKKLLPRSHIFVYEDNIQIQGFIGLTGNYIAGIFVDTHMQSKGIGKLLIDYAKKVRSNLLLHVYKKNKRAVAFYKREKFRVINEQISESTDEIEIVMEWKK